MAIAAGCPLGNVASQNDAIVALQNVPLAALIPAAVAGDLAAMAELAYRFGRGKRGAQTNLEQAAYWDQRAAAGNVAISQSRLAFMHERGLGGLGINVAEAVRLYTLAGAQGEATARHSLGMCYENAIGVAQDSAEAVRLFRLAAAQGNAGSQSALGVAYYNGRGVDRDVVQARAWSQLAADQGHADGQNNLATIYLDVDNDRANAQIWYMRAAEQGHILALQKLLGVN